jgi:hypothetical protein
MAKNYHCDDYHVGMCDHYDGVHLALMVLYDETVRQLIGELETLLQTKPRPCHAPIGSGISSDLSNSPRRAR